MYHDFIALAPDAIHQSHSAYASFSVDMRSRHPHRINGRVEQCFQGKMQLADPNPAGLDSTGDSMGRSSKLMEREIPIHSQLRQLLRDSALTRARQSIRFWVACLSRRGKRRLHLTRHRQAPGTPVTALGSLQQFHKILNSEPQITLPMWADMEREQCPSSSRARILSSR